ncbi:MAG: Gfo/Idh/MocA family oxidoreductase [Verrucomicrobiota bacterium]
MKPSKLPLPRRKFLAATAKSASAVVLGGYAATAKGFPQNETITLGLIGCGGRMRGRLLNGLKLLDGVEVAAVCDVYEYHRSSAHVLVGGREREVFQTKQYEEVLARKDIDAVMIATPDHWHAPMTIAAMETGKDVYVEKPLIHKLEEGARLIDAKKRTGRVVQVGAQQRSMPHFTDLKRKLQSGEIDIGKITRIHMQWCRNNGPYHKPTYKIDPAIVDWPRFLGNAPEQPFDAFRFRNWRWFWDFGNGALCDLMVHWLDVTNWLLDLPMPDRVVASGGNYSGRDDWEAPDTVNCVMEYEKLGLQLDFECSWATNVRKACTEIMGTDATIYFDRGRYEVTPQQKNALPIAEISHSMIAGEEPLRGLDFYTGYNGEALHIGDWLRAIREGRDPVDPIEAGILAAAPCIHGNVSYRERRMVEI